MIPDSAHAGKVEISRSGSPTRLRTDRFTGIVDPEWSERIHELIGADKSGAEPERWTSWQEVKTSTVRTIFQGALESPAGGTVPVHLKLFRAVRLSDRARDAVTGSRSAREFHNLLQARLRGLPCVRPLVAGSFTGSCGSRSFLVTITEPGTALPRGPLSEADASAAGELLRRAHDRGLHARDLHPGNLLRGRNGDMMLLDLTSASLGEALTEAERGRALAYFCLDLDGNVQDRAARPLLEGYGASAAVVGHATRSARRLRNRALSSFGRRAFRPCRTTRVERPVRKPRVFLHVPATELWDAARAAFARLASAKPPEPIKSGRRGAVYLFDGVVVKERTAAAARQLFENAYWLSFAGVPAPTPIAATTFRGRGAVATERLPCTDLLQDLQSGLGKDENSLRVCARNFGRAVGRLHSFGLRNRDLKFENLIRDPATDTIYMVDLDGVRRQVPGDNRGRAADLGRLLAAFRDAGEPGGDPVRRGFLREYVRTCRRLLYPMPHRSHVLTQAEAHARAWAAAHA